MLIMLGGGWPCTHGTTPQRLMLMMLGMRLFMPTGSCNTEAADALIMVGAWLDIPAGSCNTGAADAHDVR